MSSDADYQQRITEQIFSFYIFTAKYFLNFSSSTDILVLMTATLTSSEFNVYKRVGTRISVTYIMLVFSSVHFTHN